MEQVTVYLIVLWSQSILGYLSSSCGASVTGITRLSKLSSPPSALKRNTGRVDDAELGVWFFHKTLEPCLTRSGTVLY